MSCLRFVARRLARQENLKFARFLSSKNHVVSSPIADVEIPNVLLHQYMWNGLNKWHDKIAVECAETGRKLKYSDVKRMSDCLAGFLQKLGLKRGDSIAIVLPNVPEFFVALLGPIQAGITVSTINPVYTADEIQRQLISSASKLVITLNSSYPTVKAAIDSIPNAKIPIIAVTHTQNETLHEGSIKFHEVCSTQYEFREPTDANQEDVILLPYSSGTTGLPKGVQLTHRNLVANYAQTAVPEFNLCTETHGTNQDVIPVVLPMYHLYGLGVVAFNFFSHGVKFITLPQFTTNSFADVLHTHSPSLLFIVPPIVLMLLNNPDLHLEKLLTRSVVSAAAPLGASDIYRFKDKTNGRIHLLQLYGLTETAPLTHHQSFVLDNCIKIGGSGVALPNTQCKIVAVDDPDCRGFAPHESGELLCKGPQIMKGYLNNEEANKQIFAGDGFMRTGDIGHYDEDGHFYITDRLKELIKVKGFQVAPAELEELLRTHPDIKDAAVIGVKDERSGEVPKAFVVLKQNSKTNADAIKNFVAEKVAKYKQLAGGVVLLESIPKTASGKILRRDLKNY